jgi:hypothetical protein
MWLEYFMQTSGGAIAYEQKVIEMAPSAFELQFVTACWRKQNQQPVRSSERPMPRISIAH